MIHPFNARGSIWSLTALRAVLILLPMLIVAIATRGGISMVNDSRWYVNAAEHFAAGEGLRIYISADETRPLTQFPPMYSLLLSIGPTLGVDTIVFARWVNMVSIAGVMIVLAAMLRSVRPTWLQLLLLAFFALNLPLIELASNLLSEALFIAFSMAGLYGLHRFLSSPSWRWSTLCGMSMAGALLTRYAGIALILTACLILAWDAWQRIRSHCRSHPDWWIKGAWLAGIPCTALAGIYLRNQAAGEAAGTRTLGIHPPTAQNWQQLADAIHRFYLGSAGWLMMLVFLIACVAVVLIVHRIARPHSSTSPETKERSRKHPIAPLGWFAIVYLLFILFSHTFFDGYIPFDVRILSPAILAGTCALMLMWSARIDSSSNGTARAWRFWPGLVVLATMIGLQLPSLATWARSAPVDGMGYASRIWRELPVMKWIDSLPPDAVIYTNNPAAIYLLTRREALQVPARENPMQRVGDPNFELAKRMMLSNLENTGGYTVHFRRVRRTDYLRVHELSMPDAFELIRDGKDATVHRYVPTDQRSNKSVE